MIILYTDFGHDGPYMGNMAMVLGRLAPGIETHTLMATAPRFNPRAAGLLLAGLSRTLSHGDILLGIVDPGVGSDRAPIMVDIGGIYAVGPDNGLFAAWIYKAINQGTRVKAWRIDWRPDDLSQSFHGRDLFAPIAAKLACGSAPDGTPRPPTTLTGYDWVHSGAEVIYCDTYGNVMTGLLANTIGKSQSITIAGHKLSYAETFSAVPEGNLFWFENSYGLVEIACNQGDASRLLGVNIGDTVALS